MVLIAAQLGNMSQSGAATSARVTIVQPEQEKVCARCAQVRDSADNHASLCENELSCKNFLEDFLHRGGKLHDVDKSIQHSAHDRNFPTYKAYLKKLT